MLPSRPSPWSLALICCAAIAPLACQPAQVGRQNAGGARSDDPREIDGGLKLPDARPPAEGMGPAGPGGSPAVGPPAPGESCAMEAHEAKRPQVDLLLLLDSSSSMEQRVPGDDRTLGALVTEGLTSFVKDPASAGLGVGVRFFPGVVPSDRTASGKPCQSDMECGPDAVCRDERLCLYQGRPVSPCVGDRLEGQRCQNDEACVPSARCSLTKLPCHPAGQPCAGGMPGNLCEAEPRRCLPPAGSWACQPSVYQKLTAPIGQLPAAEASLLQAFQSVVYTFGTPTGPAVKGALAHARAHQSANPTHRVALVLGTDGAGGLCGDRNAAAVLAMVAAEAKGAPPISTFVIGAFSNEGLESGIPFVESVAAAGGTGKPFVLNTDPDLARNFLEALKKIRDVSLPCEFVIPRPNNPIDFGKVNVRLQDAAGAGADIPYVSASDRCDSMRGGWYYDVEPAKGTPTRVLTCPATCERLGAAGSAKVSLVFGCKTIVIE